MTIVSTEQLNWYMQDICMHTLGAQWEFQQLLEALGHFETRQSRFVWFHLTSFLQHAAMISKFLEPISKHRVAIARSKALRAALVVAPGSHVLPRHARDNVEHFDERIDRWVTEGNTHTILEIVVPNREGHDLLRVNQAHVKRVLIADALVFVSETKDGTKFELELPPIFEEIRRIERAAESWMGIRPPHESVRPGFIRVG